MHYLPIKANPATMEVVVTIAQTGPGLTLENLILDTRAKHKFYAVSVAFNGDCSAGAFWSANVHWRGFSRDGIPCSSGNGASPQEAVSKAIEQARQDRKPYGDDHAARNERIERLKTELATLSAEVEAA